MTTEAAPLTRAQALDATLFRASRATEAHRHDPRAERGSVVSLCGLTFSGRKVFGGTVLTINSRTRCSACEAAYEAGMARTQETPAAEVRGESSALANRAAREWSNLAGEAVTAEQIGGNLYAFGSELACLRLEHKFNAPNARASYSAPRASWYFCVEPIF